MEVNNLDKLVKAVTSNILDKLDYKPEFKLDDKSCLILVPNIGLGFNEYYDYIIKNYPGYDLYLGSSEEFTETHYIEKSNIKYLNFDVKNSEFIKILDAVNTIVILGLKISQMKSLSKADDLEDVNHIILESVMVNKSVNIMLNTNGLIFNKIVEIVKDLRSYGINVVNIQQNALSKINNELITESYVLNLRENGLKSVILNKKQIITPLAKDKLRELKINIEYHKEEN